MSIFALSCLIASILLYIIYVTYTYIKYSPDCISLTYYLLKKKELFTIWILLVSFLIFPSWVEISPINIQFLPFLSVISLAGVGLTPKYLEEDKLRHLIFAISASIISLIWNIVFGIYIIPIILGIIAILLIIFKVKNYLFWVENVAFLNIFLSIIFK